MKLYVGNISFTITEADLQHIFEQFGSVTEIRVVTDRETGQPRGFAFVTMSNEPEGRAAIKSLDGKEFGGRSLKSARLALKKIGPHDPRHVHADSGDPSGTITRVCARSSGRRFMKLATDYLSCYPSDFYTLRDLRNRQTDPPAKTREGYLAVHRHNNMLYKRLEPEGFVILTALSRGVTVEDACAEALYII